MSTPTPAQQPNVLEAQDLARRWVAYSLLTPDEAAAVEFAANQRGHGIDCLTASASHPREMLVSLAARGLMSFSWCQPVDGDGWSTSDEEVEGWELTGLGSPPTHEERERLFTWARERMGDYIEGRRTAGRDFGGHPATSRGFRASLADAIGDALGVSGCHGLGSRFEDGANWAICEAAGWPS